MRLPLCRSLRRCARIHPGENRPLRLRFLRAALQDREQVEADQMHDALFLGADALARELAAEHARRGELGRAPQLPALALARGLGREQATGRPFGQRAGVALVLLVDRRIEWFHIPLRRQVSMNWVKRWENSM